MSTKALGAVLLLLFIFVGVIWFYLPRYDEKPNKMTGNVDRRSATPTRIREESWLRYHDVEYQFSLKYPQGWNYQVNDPYVPNLAEHTVTFSSSDGSSVFDVWVRKDSWEQIVSEFSKEPGVYQDTIAGSPAFVQTIDKANEVTYVKHPSIAGTVVILTISQGSRRSDANLEIERKIKNSLAFE
jgi:hypothetical protein